MSLAEKPTIMRKAILFFAFILAAGVRTALAVDNNTVEVKFNGSTATVTIASNISSYVTNNSSGSHVKLVQSENFAGVNKTVDNEDGEIIYVLSGTSTDGEFFLEGSFKCTVQLDGLTLTNPSGPAINIQNGKRVDVSIKKGTTNSIADGANDDYNGCFHCKGHTKFKGKGTLNVVGKSRHAIYSKEYMEVKNATINVTGAKKDAIHCKEYFLMESGTLTITGADDDGIQVELSSDPATGKTADHEDENTGNFYMEDGTLSISGYGGKAIKADGTITYSGGKRNFPDSDTEVNAAIGTVSADSGTPVFFDLNGRHVAQPAQAGIYIVRQGSKTTKRTVR